MSAGRLSNFACIVLQGPDARRFAQAQFAGNVEHLAAGHWQWNAWLTAQGKVSLLLHLVDPGDGQLIAVARGGDADAACTTLSRYLLRAKVTLAVHTCAGFAGGPLVMGTVRTDTAAITLGYGERSLMLRTVSAPNEAVDDDADRRWRLADIRAGWPSLPAGEPQWLPPALGLEHLGAVAFDKGCYPGQELAARLHYRGGHKRRLYHLQSAECLPVGSARDGRGNALEVLDCVADGNGFASLAVAPVGYEPDINSLGAAHKVISSFDA